MTHSKASLDSIIGSRNILIVCGTGGVGKTTLSAAIAIRAAILGRKVVVVTIDPAKRLAQALGIAALSDDPLDLTNVVQSTWQKSVGTPGPALVGSLHALMPDTRKTFERFVVSLTKDAMTAERIFKNPIFQVFAKEFSGTNEYMALQKLAALQESGKFDLIVLDTPPSRNTLGFLDGPKLLSRLFDEKLLHWMGDSESTAQKILSGGLKKALGVLESLIGKGFMGNLFDFAKSLMEIRIGFSANLKKMMAILHSQDSGFLIVSSPLGLASRNEDIQHLLRRLSQEGYPYDGMILNRCISEIPEPKSTPTPDILSKEAWELLAQTAKVERQALEQRAISTEARPILKIPELARDVHSLEDLLYVARMLDPESKTP